MVYDLHPLGFTGDYRVYVKETSCFYTLTYILTLSDGANAKSSF